MRYEVVKTYGHNEGWSTAFRQYLAIDSHCRYVHGYPLSFEFKFGCDTLDARNWCLDFGSLKDLKSWLQSMFDHKLVVDKHDPQLEWFQEAGKRGIADIIVTSGVGCELFAEMAADAAIIILMNQGESDRVKLLSVKVAEHSGNSAIFTVDHG